MSAAVIATGFAELDATLASLDVKLQRKYVRTALNRAIKIIRDGFRALCPVNTGAMRDAARVRNPITKKRGTFARALIIERERLFALQQKRSGRSLVYSRLVRGKRRLEQFFYPVLVELGSQDTPAQRPMRAALYGNANHVRDEFVKQLRLLVAEAEAAKSAVSLESATAMAWALDLEGSA
jgi:HK97 gp10 family phage protein